MAIYRQSIRRFIEREGRIPAPLQLLITNTSHLRSTHLSYKSCKRFWGS